MNEVYLPSLLIDICILAISLRVLIGTRVFSLLHPATVYFGFHLFCVTSRLLMLLSGATIMAAMPGVMSPDEIIKGAAYGDLALVGVTFGWWAAARAGRRKALRRSAAAEYSKPILLAVAGISGVIGFVGLANFGFSVTTSSIDLGQWQSSSYVFMTVTWMVQAMLLFHFVLGFRPWLLACTCVVLFVTMYNAARFAVILGILFLFFTYASQSGRRWLPGNMVVVGAVAGLLYFPMKPIGKALQQGASLTEAAQVGVDFYALSLHDESVAEVGFLDMGSCIITLSDRRGERFWGKPWLDIFLLPVPRQLWADKPGLNEYLKEIETPERPVHQMGMTPLVFGDAYLNFGLAGVLFWPMVIGYFMGRFYTAAMRQAHFSPTRLVYLTLLATSLQLYRDCLAQAILFPTTAFMPSLIAAGMQKLLARRRRRRAPLGGNVPPQRITATSTVPA